VKNNFAILQSIYNYYLKYPQISFDSRENVANTIFFALKGNYCDGNVFASQALDKGAAYVIIDNSRYYQADERYILVDDTLTVLQQLANFHRKHLNIPIIAITGSNGKTTTKELVYAILSQRYNCYATVGNFNNHIGVPISLLSIKDSTEIAIIEMGANHVGEIAQLCEIAQPTHGVITNISHAHLEGFGGFEGVVKGKSELYSYLKQCSGVSFINSADSVLLNAASGLFNPIYYPQSGDFYHCELVEASPYIIYKSEQGETVTTQLIGKHHFYNIAAALCIGKYFNIEEGIANAAIQAYKPSNNRSQLINKGSNIILLDAYNANPASVQAALESFSFLKAAHKVLILADMNELGEESLTFHQQIVKQTAQQNYDKVILYGNYMEKASSYNSKAIHFKQMKDLQSYLNEAIFVNTSFLLKGSRSYHLENLLAFIKDDSHILALS
jgi:UDP-N-acetylmuramoyl-tripeptide--D-alanyl-D-alanine ligase